MQENASVEEKTCFQEKAFEGGYCFGIVVWAKKKDGIPT